MLKTLTYPGTIDSNQYTYDTNNQLKTYVIPGLAANNNTLTYQYRWNAIKEITMPGNLKRTVTLDPLQRPERILVKSTNASIPAIMDHRYQYDEVSNIKKKTTLDGDYVYGYDELDRLTAATPPLALQQSASNPEGLPVESYDYDPVHNRMSSAHQPGSWVYNANNELSEWGLDAEKRMMSYDENGSTVKEELGGSQITDYVYDAQDRLVEVKKNNAVIAKYAYDPMGRRIWREAEGSVTWFLYSDEGLIQEISGANQVIRTYGWNPGGMWGTDTVWQNDANGTFLTHNDHLYTTDVLTNATNSNKAWGALRESFGKTAVQSGNQTEYLMRFPGQWEDEVGGFSQNSWREYSNYGRFISIDPSFIDSGVNLFAYSNGNPNSFFDFNGNHPTPVLRAWLRAYTLCKATHLAYDGMKGLCKNCKDKSCNDDLKFLLTQCACWSSYVSLRKRYLNMRCDYIMPGSIARGSRVAEEGHKTALRQAKVPRNLCCLKAGIKLFMDYGPIDF